MLTRVDLVTSRRTSRLLGAFVVVPLVSVISVMGLTACERPSPPAPLDLEAAAKLAKLAAAASASAAVAPTPAAEAPPAPVLVESAFTSEKPSSACSPTEVTSCSLDIMQNAEAKESNSVKTDETLHAVGWAVDQITGTVPSIVLFELEGKKSYYTTAMRISKRPDVAEVTKNPSFVDSGYDVLVPMKDVAPGEYTINLFQVNASGAALLCNTKRKLKVE